MKKMKNLFRKGALLISAVSLLGMVGCSSDDEGTTSRLTVALVDAPADYDQVLIDVQDVQVNVSGEDEGGEWQSLDDVAAQEYDLLELTAGNEAILGDIVLPAGTLSQIRLILGDNNRLVMDGEEIVLSTPSAQQSGLKINVNADLTGDFTYKMILDFDASKSIVKAGNSGRYNLKPVIRASLEATSGAISGVVLPDSISYYAVAVNESMDSATTYPNEANAFTIKALQPGSYDVSIIPDSASGFSTLTTEDIIVTMGETTALDTLMLTN